MGVTAAVAAAVATTGAAAASVSNSRRAASAAQNAANTGASVADPAAANRPEFQNWVMSNWQALSNPDPNAIMKNPNFQFLKGMGERGIAGGNSRDFGSNRNGTFAEDMATFDTGLASNFIQQQFQNNMQLLGLGGAFGGFTTGNPAAAGQLIAQGGQNAFANQNNVWSTIGAQIPVVRNAWGNVNFPSGGNTNWAAPGGPTPDYTGWGL